MSLWGLFETKAVALGASVVHVDGVSTARAAIVATAPDAVGTDACAERFPALRLQPWRSASGPEPACGDVVWVADLALAETGSLLVIGSSADRGAALLAQRLWLLVQAQDIVATLDEALTRTGAAIAEGHHYATFMSGPSRTADIERTLTIGVHGPQALAIVVVGQHA
jgi:L-lactate dehydrogenase complex protein LldG